jgi:hypothetical protein
MSQNAQTRKRNAVGQLKELASELGVPTVALRGISDCSKSVFLEVHKSVEAKLSTPKHRTRSQQALQLYFGGAMAVPKLSAVPKLPAMGPPAHAHPI